MTLTIRIIRPSSREAEDLLAPRLQELRRRGVEPVYEDLAPDPAWAYTAASIKDRSEALERALCETSTQAVWAARGGYGASDLLPELPWADLATKPAKLVIGFSDVAALHSALYGKLGWRGLHAPMPATSLWGDGGGKDVDRLFELLGNLEEGKPLTGEITVSPVGRDPGKLDGPLFGGCFTVLTHLIGTPYLPARLKDHILFFEDIGEHPARLMRALNQWIQSGMLEEVQAIVLGGLRNMGDTIEDDADYVYEQFSARSPVPVFRSPDFGHLAPNEPLVVGAQATLEAGRLRWSASGPAPEAQGGAP